MAPFTGPASIEAAEYNAGIRLAIKAANAAGGINGQQVVLKTANDEYKPEQAVAIFRQLAAENTVATLLPVGSPAMGQILKEGLPETLKLPIVGLIPAAEPFRAPLNPYVYHIRAGDLSQYRKLVEHALTTGARRIAVAYADIPFGTAGLAAIEGMLKKQGQNLVARIALPMADPARLPEIVDALARNSPDIVFMVSPAKLAGDFLKVYRAKGLSAPLAMPSYGNADVLCAIAGKDSARGVIMAQVMPNVSNTAIPIVRRFQEDIKKHGEKDMRPNILQLEAYVTTQVLLEGLRRAGTAAPRQKLVPALDALKRLDLGGYAVEFSPTRHTGSEFVDISIIGRDCKLMF
jgi:branched-chain amino acid transport system substrate-binding protein